MKSFSYKYFVGREKYIKEIGWYCEPVQVNGKACPLMDYASAKALASGLSGTEIKRVRICEGKN